MRLFILKVPTFNWLVLLALIAVTTLEIVSGEEQAAPLLSDFVGKYSYPSNRKIKIDPTLLGKNLAKVTVQSGQPYYFSKNNGDQFNFDHFIEYLEGKGNRPKEYSTGKEDELKIWVLAQPDNSIDPLKIYAKALSLNSGNIFAAILCIHQLLRNNARWFDSRRYVYKSSQDAAQKFFNKFIDIRGDLSERGKGFVGDHSGSWYRLWGMMLYRGIWQEDTRFQNRSCASGFGLFVKDCVRLNATKIVSKGAEFCKLGRKDDLDLIGKEAVNQLGGDSMSALLDTLKGLQESENQKLSDINSVYMKFSPHE